MKYKVKALIFDFDLTLVDSRIVAAKAWGYLLDKYNIRSDNINENKLWGRTFKINALEAKEVSNTSLSAEEIERILIEQATIHYTDIKIVAKPLLKKWEESGIKLCIVSGNTESIIKKVINNRNNKDINFSLIYETNSGRSKAQGILDCLDKLGISKNEAMYVGDHINDVTAAKEAGVSSCAVCTGIHTKDEFLPSKPDLIINELSELEKYLD